MVMALAACSGSAKDKMKGDWIYETIAGDSVADYAAKLGVDESAKLLAAASVVLGMVALFIG